MTIDLLLAHQGGWDEMFILLSPVAVFAVLRLLERRRRQRRRGSDRPVGDAPDEPEARSG